MQWQVAQLSADAIAELVQQLAGAMHGLALPLGQPFKTQTCIAELLNNAVEHGGGAGQPCELRLRVRPESVVVALRSPGFAAMPTLTAARAVCADQEDGRGLWIVQQWVDELRQGASDELMCIWHLS